jgi:hypothetical protein
MEQQQVVSLDGSEERHTMELEHQQSHNNPSTLTVTDHNTTLPQPINHTTMDTAMAYV